MHTKYFILKKLPYSKKMEYMGFFIAGETTVYVYKHCVGICCLFFKVIYVELKAKIKLGEGNIFLKNASDFT